MTVETDSTELRRSDLEVLQHGRTPGARFASYLVGLPEQDYGGAISVQFEQRQGVRTSAVAFKRADGPFPTKVESAFSPPLDSEDDFQQAAITMGRAFMAAEAELA